MSINNKNEKLYIETNQNIIGNYTGLTPIEQKCILYYVDKIIKESINPYYIEIGVLYGGTLNNVLQSFKEQINVIGIDLFEDFKICPENTHGGDATYQSLLQEILLNKGYNNFVLLKGDSSTTINSLSKIESVCCFIDGDHSYQGSLRDFISIYNKMNQGYILFHDSDYFGLPETLEKVRMHQNIIQIDKQDTISVFKKVL